MPSRFAAVINKEIHIQAVPEIHEEGDEVDKYKLSLSLALLYLVDLFLNKLKTKFNNLFYRMVLNTKRIHNSL